MTRPDLLRRLPESQCGIAEITHYEVPKGYIDFSALRSGIRLPLPGKYVRLTVGGSLVMSNTDMEWDSNWDILQRAHGRVLIAGLGIGLILPPILKQSDEVLVIEKHQDVIDLIAPRFRHRKLSVECADIFEWHPPNGSRWNVIYFDVWPTICTDNLQEIARLHQRYKFKLDRSDPDCWMGSWMQDHLRWLKGRGY